ncbi:DUF1653 domain-containing protein [Bacillus bombysepticus]|uniref:DUF1653 domain-containing protein n=1 Tax=Bacillus bombysepticus TaxID=658666 RepID=UPI00301A8522
MKPKDILKHHSSNLYRVLFRATDTNNGETVVIYQALYNMRIFARPIYMFNNLIQKPEGLVPRFKVIAKDEAFLLSYWTEKLLNADVTIFHTEKEIEMQLKEGAIGFYVKTI